jgi:hypothetical protein
LSLKLKIGLFGIVVVLLSAFPGAFGIGATSDRAQAAYDPIMGSPAQVDIRLVLAPVGIEIDDPGSLGQHRLLTTTATHERDTGEAEVNLQVDNGIHNGSGPPDGRAAAVLLSIDPDDIRNFFISKPVSDGTQFFDRYLTTTTPMYDIDDPGPSRTRAGTAEAYVQCNSGSTACSIVVNDNFKLVGARAGPADARHNTATASAEVNFCDDCTAPDGRLVSSSNTAIAVATGNHAFWDGNANWFFDGVGLSTNIGRSDRFGGNLPSGLTATDRKPAVHGGQSLDVTSTKDGIGTAVQRHEGLIDRQSTPDRRLSPAAAGSSSSEGTSVILPPNTGDAGLVASDNGSSMVLFAIVAAIIALSLGLAFKLAARR